MSRLSRNRTSQPVTMCRLERRSHEEKPQTFYRRGEGGTVTQSPCLKEVRVGDMPGTPSPAHRFLPLAAGILRERPCRLSAQQGCRGTPHPGAHCLSREQDSAQG